MQKTFDSPRISKAVFASMLSLFFIGSYSYLEGGNSETLVNSGTDRDWKITLVSEDEPGDPMIISGKVYAADGETPIGGITVHVYHTDAQGYYSKDGRNERNHRIKGDMVTNEEGKYQFITIKPASYPNTRVPSHVHYVISGKGYPEQRRTLQFKGDRHLSQRAIERAEERGIFSSIIQLEMDDNGILKGEFNIRLEK